MRQIPSVETLDLVVDRTLVPELKCPICFTLFRIPVVQCVNGHLFCLDCVGNLQFCPTCRIPISKDSLARSLYVERQLQTLRVHCVYRFPDEAGSEEDACPVIVQLSELESHQASCECRIVPCNFCGERFRWRRLGPHQASECPKRPVQCPHCAISVRIDLLQRHVDDDCPGRPTACALCATLVPRSGVAAHAARDCVEAVVVCPFEEHGCRAGPMKRGQVQQHLRDEAFEHMRQMQELFTDQSRLLKQALLVRDLRISALEQQLSQVRNAKVKQTIIWEIANWDGVVKTGRKFLRSKSFAGAPGFEFFLGCFPFGEGSSPARKMTCCLFLDVDKGVPDARITVDFSLSVVNWAYEPMTITHLHENVHFPLEVGSSGSKGWGPEDGLVKTDFLTRDSGFLSNDGRATLTINATFRVVNVLYKL